MAIGKIKLMRYKIIEEYIENKKYAFLDRAYDCANSFWGAFFEFSVINASADMYDVFGDRPFYHTGKYISAINDRTGDRYFRMMAFIHLTEFTAGDNRFTVKEGYKYFEQIFTPDNMEKRMFDLLMRCFFEFNTEFGKLRTAVFMKYVFSVRGDSDNMLAFMSGFCYNSYKRFLASFGRFMTVERRLEIAK